MNSDHRIGLATLSDEIDIAGLPVRGELPSWLSGVLIRNGPAMFEHGDRSFRHWFDGQGMLHRFEFSGGPQGGVSYRNRALDTLNRRSLLDEGRIAFGEFATDPCASLFGRLFTRFARKSSDNGSVNVAVVDGKSLAVTETNLAIQFDPVTLSTLGVVGYGREVASGPLTTAHPHIVPGSPDIVNYVLEFGRHSKYVIYRHAAGAAPVTVGEIPADRPGYVHSFAVTERYAVLAVFPFVVNPLALVLRGRPFIENYRWRPELGMRIVAMDLADGTIRADVTAPAAFAFHHINAFDDGGDLVIDMCTYPDASIVDALYLDRLRGDQVLPAATPTRYRVDPGRGSVEVTSLGDGLGFELPRIDYARNGRTYRYAYGCGLDRTSSGFFDRLVKLDVAVGGMVQWRQDGCFPGEPVFVPAPGGSAEDDGVVLSVVLDSGAGRSALVVLDAATFTELARAEVPHAVPYGFHGQFSTA